MTVTTASLAMNTGARIPQVGLGVYQTPRGQSTRAAVEAALRLGYRHVDTARIYGAWAPGGDGASEKTLGAWMESRGMREKFVVSTKGAHPDLATMHISRIAPADIAADVAASLDALRTDYIDTYWLHRDDPSVPVGEILGALNEHLAAGRIRAYNGRAMAMKKGAGTARKQRRVLQILEGLDQAYPNAQCALRHTTPLELLIATILSAQCTDERVNLVTRDLFRKYRGPRDYVEAPQEVLENDIRSTGFFRNKAKSIQGAGRMILGQFSGKVPDTMEELVRLPGVARKTANVVLGVVFRKAEGIVVDTHVTRLSGRLELTSEEDAGKIESDLLKLIPREKWIQFSHQLIHHGRQVCKARKPLCFKCSLAEVCRSEDRTDVLLPGLKGRGK